MVEHRARLITLAKTSSWVGLAKILGSFLGLTVTALITRTLGAADAGSVFFVLSTLYAMELFLRLGTHRLFVKDVAINHTSKTNTELGKIIGAAYAQTILTGTLTAVCMFLISTTTLKVSIEGAELGVLFKIVALSAPIYSLAWVSGFILQGLSKPILLVLQQNILLQIFLILTFLFVTPGSATEVVVYWALANSLTTALVLSLVTYQSRPIFSHESFVLASEKIKKAGPLWWTDIASLIERHGFIIYLGMATSLEAAGIFFVAIRINKAIAGIAGSLNVVIAPVFAKLNASDGIAAVAKLYFKVTLALLCLSTIGLIVAVLGLETLLVFFGEEYKSAHIACSILLAGTLFNISTGPTGQVLVMTGNQRVEGKAANLKLFSLILLTVPLSLAYSMDGVAMAIAASIIFASLYRVIAIFKIFGFGFK